MAAVIGLGFVGGSMFKSYQLKGVDVKGYDKYKDSDEWEECLNKPLMFLSLPTLYSDKLNSYDYSAIFETCDKLQEVNYTGLVIVKSTVQPMTTDNLSSKYPQLSFVHNPEFLHAHCAFEDFHNQDHIVIGKTENCPSEKIENLVYFYNQYYPDAEIFHCWSLESEMMKISLNSVAAVKVQIFNELYLLCQKMNISYETVLKLMLRDSSLNEPYTQVPGHDGKMSYGGVCLPKDSKALLAMMKKMNVPHRVLEATTQERDEMRDDFK